MPEYVYDVDGAQVEKTKAQKLSKQNKSLLLVWVPRIATQKYGKIHIAIPKRLKAERLPQGHAGDGTDNFVPCTVLCRILPPAMDVADQCLVILARLLQGARPCHQAM